MKKFNLMAVAAGLLLLSAPAALFADDATDKSAAKPGSELRDMTPEERKDYFKAHPELAKRFKEARSQMWEKNRGTLERAGLNVEELKGMDPAERRDKVKKAVDTRVTDLEKKKAEGTALTEQEQSDLDSLKQFQKNMQSQGGNRRGPKAKKPAPDDNK
jgi:hypothetical protein